MIGIKNGEYNTRDYDLLSEYHRKWVEEVLKKGSDQRDSKWSESIAADDKEFVMETKTKLGAKAIGRKEIENHEGYEIKEPRKILPPLFLSLKSVL